MEDRAGREDRVITNEGLRDWLDAAITERAARAEAAAVSLTDVPESGRWEQQYDGHRGGYIVSRPARRPGTTTPPLTDAVPESAALAFGESAATHITANDPESVLRRCAADRESLNAYAETLKLHNEYRDRIQAARDRGAVPDAKDLAVWSEASSDLAVMAGFVLNLARGYGWKEEA